MRKGGLVRQGPALEGGKVSPDHGEIRHVLSAALDDAVQAGGLLGLYSGVVQGLDGIVVGFHSKLLLF